MASFRKLLTPVGIGIIILTLITAIIHLYLGTSFGNPLFLLNGLGYLTLMVLYFIPSPAVFRYRGIIRWLYIGFTAITVILFFVFNGAEAWQSTLGLITKAVEIVLIILLFLDGRRSVDLT